MSSGRVWPYAIGIAITLVFGFCVATVFVTESSKVQESDAYMTHYQDADMHANELIHQRMLFDKRYKIDYISESIAGSAPKIRYRVSDLEGHPIDDASIKLSISRPETEAFDQTLEHPQVEDGLYTFVDAKFPKAGLWNIIAKVSVGEYERFYNVKVDTRSTNSYEF